MRSLVTLIGIALVATLFAGCVGDDGDTPDGDGGTGPAPTAEATGSTGSVTGDIASSSLEPIPGASVFLSKGSNLTTTTTDGEGKFTFNGVAPGAYTLDVTAIGFMNKRAGIDVEAGKVVRQSFLLDPIVVLEPYHDTLEFTGFYECAFGTVFITDTCTFVQRTAYDAVKDETGQDPPFPRDAQNNDNTFYWTVKPGLRAVVSEMVWDDTAQMTDEMMMLLSSTPIHNDCDCSDEDYIQVTTTSPARAIVGADIPEGYFPEDMHVMEGDSKLFSHIASAENGSLEVASRGFLPFSASAAYQQPFTIYVTAFYHELPTPDFTAIPDQ